MTSPPEHDARPAVNPRHARQNRRLRVLFALAAVGFALFAFSMLDRSIAERFGLAGEALHDMLDTSHAMYLPLNARGRQFVADVEALGGHPGVQRTRRGLLSAFHREDRYDLLVRENRSFDDAALGRIADLYGDRMMNLNLENTGVTDEGLRHLNKTTMLRHLHFNAFKDRTGNNPPAITDAGMDHLKGLNHLWTLHLTGLPITDAGLTSIADLPELNGLYLQRTKVRGRGLASMKSLPLLSILYLDDSEFEEQNLKALSAATKLHILSLKGVPLTPAAIPLLKAIPGLERLELTGCGLLDEEVDDLIKARPGLKVVRD